MRLLERLWNTPDLVVLVVGIVVITPLVTSDATLDPALTPQFLAWAIGSSVLCLVLLVQIAIRPTGFDSGILKRAIFPAHLGFLLFSVLSLTQAVNVGEGVYECLKTVLSAVFLLMATSIFLRRAGSVALVAKAVVITAIVISLVGSFQFLKYGVVDRPGYSLLNGTTGHKNLLGSGLFVLLPFCLYTVLACRGFWSIMASISLVFILPLIFLTRSRAVWLALFVSVALAAVIAFTVLRQVTRAVALHTPNRVLGKLALVAAACLVVIMLLTVYQARSHSLGDFFAAATNTHSFFERLSVWGRMSGMVQDHALWGVGAGNWKIVFPSYGLLTDAPTDRLKTTAFIRPHNDFLWVWSEIGTAGLLFYAATFAISLFYALRVMRQRPWSSDTLLSSLVFLGLVGYIVIACFSFSKERVFDSVFLLLMMAVVTSLYHQRFPSRPSHSGLFLIGVLLVSQVMLLCGAAVGYARLNAEVHTKRALAARRAQDWPGVTHEIDAAYSAFASLDPMATPLKWYRGEADFALGNLSQATLDYAQALTTHPHHIHVLNNLATCYTLVNRPAEAVRLYEEALRIFPRFTEAACNLAAVHFNRGDYVRAYHVLAQCGPDAQNATLERYRRIVAAKLVSESRSTSDGSPQAGTPARRTLDPPFTNKLSDVHRLWSSSCGRCFHTIDVKERDAFLGRPQEAWTDDGIAYRAFTGDTVPGVAPVHRFYSPVTRGYFYTMSPEEMQSLLQGYSDRWRYEGTAFYAFPEGRQPHEAEPVYRFWAPSLQYHLYTIDEHEARQLRTLHSSTWTYEGVAWYACPTIPSAADNR